MNHVRRSIALIIFASMVLYACGSDKSEPLAPEGNDTEQPVTKEWLIPQDRVKDGGPGKDGIPAINTPKFQSDWSNLSVAGNNDLVVIYRPSDGSKARVYPHPILDWHEIVNDKAGNKLISVTYCPLTGSTVTVDRNIISGTTLGVSGLLYNNNLINISNRQPCINRITGYPSIC